MWRENILLDWWEGGEGENWKGKGEMGDAVRRACVFFKRMFGFVRGGLTSIIAIYSACLFCCMGIRSICDI